MVKLVLDKLLEKRDVSRYELARRTGVNSPTSKKKEELINEIIAIESGEKKPHIPKTKQGRPPKNFGYDNLFSTKNSVKNNFSKILHLNQEKVEYQVGEVVTLSGVDEIMENGSGFLWVNENLVNKSYFVNAGILSKWSLMSGDFVMCSAEQKADQLVVTDILTINSCPALKFDKRRKNYFEIPHIPSENKIEFSSKNSIQINKGENIYFYGTDNNLNTTNIIKLLNDCKCENKLYINVSIVEKNKHYLNMLNGCELFVANLTDEVETARRIVTLAIERAMRLIELNEDVVIVVDDAISVASVDMQDLSILKRLMSITKNAGNGSISIFAIMDKDKQINQIEKLADKKFNI